MITAPYSTFGPTAVTEAVARRMKQAAHPTAKFIAGGTNLIDLMKENVEQPGRLVDINRYPWRPLPKRTKAGYGWGRSLPTPKRPTTPW